MAGALVSLLMGLGEAVWLGGGACTGGGPRGPVAAGPTTDPGPCLQPWKAGWTGPPGSSSLLPGQEPPEPLLTSSPSPLLISPRHPFPRTPPLGSYRVTQADACLHLAAPTASQGETPSLSFPKSPPPAPLLVGRSLDTAGESWGGCDGAPGSASCPIPALPPPCPSQVPNHFPAVWAAPSQRALIIDGAGSWPGCLLGRARPPFGKWRPVAECMPHSPAPGATHPRLKSGPYRPGRGASRGGQRWSGSLVSPLGPLGRPEAFLVAQRVKNLPAMQETWVRSLGREDPLEKRMAAHSSILAWSIPWTEEPGGPQPMGSHRVGHD